VGVPTFENPSLWGFSNRDGQPGSSPGAVSTRFEDLYQTQTQLS